MRALCLTLALVASPALAEAPRELAAGVQALAVQSGTVVALGVDGQPEPGLVLVPAGYLYTLPGHQRLTQAFTQLQADKAAAEARAGACTTLVSLQQPRESPRLVSAPSLVVLGVLLLAAGVAGYQLGRR